MNTFDRYILRRFWHVFAIGFVATFGLYVVFDAFTNADEYQADAFAARTTGAPQALADALLRLASTSLAPPAPHGLHTALHASHPPLAERVRALSS